jgi:Na+-transporting NADH:ubiquinone oxidoreductase subunit C
VQPSARYTLLFAAAVCIVCSVLVSSSAVLLRERQVENQLVDRQKKVLLVAGLMREGESLAREEVRRRFADNLEPRVVDLETGAYVDDVDPETYDQRKAARDPARSRRAPENAAGVQRVPNRALVYLLRSDGAVDSIILPVQGMGLWSVLYGYLALAPDTRTIRNIIFYEHGETPGLGGEVDNPRWKGLWAGRLAFDENWQPAISVVKGRAGPPEKDPYHVDGLSGATLTSNGVTNLLRFWLGEEGFGPYLEAARREATVALPRPPRVAAVHREVGRP